MRNKRIKLFTAAGMLLFGMIVILNLPNKAKSELYLGEPTVFIHGYKGTANSFGFMLNRFEKKYGWGNKGLVYRISKEGKIRDYNLSKGQHAPTFVQIILENNRASFADSSEWISNALGHMQEKYDIDSVNLVGHSMGGILSVKYAMDYAGEDYPQVNKIITIGSPFDGIYSEEYFHIHQDAAAMDLKPGSLALQLLKEGTFPANMDVLSIGSAGDAIALPESVQALRTIIPNSNLQEIMIENVKLGHSALHENKEVDKMIHSFLWQDAGQ
ncbi:alpha/beta fold hydrolase [Oceanobacillus saliphilus]|uniref:alpha/beta fold hydrolase n=1 Tax=Oceanobacillus saliphilus TaxID=2925834 RepID=UPI00201DB2CE|nr:alpha/beta fold hydrolase [Oceanobacillus saliphilus]